MNGNRIPAWTIKQLKDALTENLAMCQTAHEQIMCKAVGGKEIREKAIEWARIRKLSPGEVAIAQEFGYKG